LGGSGTGEPGGGILILLDYFQEILLFWSPGESWVEERGNVAANTSENSSAI
jgi:hypothetical protein